jgi:hypothetical protein
VVVAKHVGVKLLDTRTVCGSAQVAQQCDDNVVSLKSIGDLDRKFPSGLFRLEVEGMADNGTVAVTSQRA